MRHRIRVGVDVGGTFTDFVLVDEERDLIYTGKRLTTPDDPGDAILAGLERLVRDAGVSVQALDGVVHGTTLVANTLIEGTGAKVGLVTTRGFRDALEMGREIRYDLYDLFATRPAPLVPRRRRHEVAERVAADGTVLEALDPSDVRRVARDLRADGVEAVAVCLVHAYRNPAHEQLVARVLAEELPGLPVSVSSDVAPEIREYERTSTTCANAYVRPRMQRYLERLEARLAKLGVRGPLHIMLSGGGITTVRAAREHPIRLVESGPAAGAMAAAYYGSLARTPSMISFDMGGTTAKMCLIEHGWPARVHELEAGRVRRFRKGSGHPLKVPVVEMIEIGAGGGSIARVDAMGLLKVGPQSAGAEPGPVCYGRGGRFPTVTDADLLLGYLSPDYFLGGEMRLDRAAVERAIEEHVARPLGLPVHDAAVGIHNVVNENMAAATRMHVAEKGRDPRRYTLVAFGGAGPVHAWGLARLLKIPRIVCPFGAGVTSALGMLVAAPAIDLTRSYVARLASLDWARVETLFAGMETEARALLTETGADPAEISVRRAADMRYAGQGFEVTVPLPDGALGPARLGEVEAAFHATYRERFGREIGDVAVEALSWRLSASAPVPNVSVKFGGQPTDAGEPRKSTRAVWFPDTGVAPCPVLNRYALPAGLEFIGPVVVEERESTTVIGPGSRVTVDAHLNLLIDLEPGRP
ncbi:MAG: hydantoinase/oxoprolinase family protein [Candidatus Rokubacteria bacterium]|nr:hydantoinase/oxoprolinase family protein [Candidatus Rokubacteria bacterium]